MCANEKTKETNLGIEIIQDLKVLHKVSGQNFV